MSGFFLPPLLWLSGAFLLGLPVGFALPLPGWAWLVAGGLAGLVFAWMQWGWGTASWRTLLLRRAVLALAVFCLGAGRAVFGATVERDSTLSGLYGQKVALTGWLVEPPWPAITGGSAPAYLQVERIQPQSGEATRPVRTRVLVRLEAGSFQYGDRLRIDGTLKAPPEGQSGSYREYLARRGVTAQIARAGSIRPQPGSGGSSILRWLYAQRSALYQVTNRIFPQPEAALLNGILLGLDGDLPPALSEAYKITGTAHIIAISGFNISILSALFFSLFRKMFARWGALAAAILSTTAYALLVGAEPPVLRAAVMGAMFLLGREIGRSAAGLPMLAFSASLMCLENPRLPWDASFQLSFMATLGLILYAGPLQAGFRRLLEKKLAPERAARIAGPVGEYLLVTLAAQITTLPVMVVHFERLSTVALLSNPLVLPPQPLVMVLSGLAVLAGRAWLPLGQLLGALVWPLAAYTNRMVALLARIPGASLDLAGAGLGFALAYYAALLSLPLLAKNWNKARAAVTPAIGLSGLALLAGLVWGQAAARPDGRLHLSALRRDGQVGYLVQFPRGQRVLIGSLPQTDLDRLGGAGARLLDAIILPAPVDADEAGMLALVETHGRPAVFAPDAAWEATGMHRFEMDLVDGGGVSAGLETGLAWTDGAARLEALAVDGANAAILIQYGNLRVLLPGQAPPEALRQRLAQLGGLTLLIVEDEAGRAAWAGESAQQRLVISQKNETDLLTSDGRNLWAERGRID